MSEKLYILALLEANPEVTLQVLENGEERPLDTQHSARCYTEQSIGGEGPPVKIRWLEVQHGEVVYRFGANPEMFIPSLYEVENITAQLLKATDQATLHAANDRLIRYFATEREVALEQLSSTFAGRPEWDFLDFCYFSVVTMTTLGYGDIIPNSRKVRYWVMLQAILGVAFAAYALTFLWPKDSSK